MVSRGKGSVGFAQYTLGEEAPFPQKVETEAGGALWNRKWDVPAGSKWRRQMNDQRKTHTLLRLPGRFTFPPLVQLRVVSFQEVHGVAAAPGPYYRMMRIRKMKFRMPNDENCKSESPFGRQRGRQLYRGDMTRWRRASNRGQLSRLMRY